MKKLVITDGVNYVKEDSSMNEGLGAYTVTQNISEAKNFRWYWLIVSKKLVLNGIKSIFGNQYDYKLIGG